MMIDAGSIRAVNFMTAADRQLFRQEWVNLLMVQNSGTPSPKSGEDSNTNFARHRYLPDALRQAETSRW